MNRVRQTYGIPDSVADADTTIFDVAFTSQLPWRVGVKGDANITLRAYQNLGTLKARGFVASWTRTNVAADPISATRYSRTILRVLTESEYKVCGKLNCVQQFIVRHVLRLDVSSLLVKRCK